MPYRDVLLQVGILGYLFVLFSLAFRALRFQAGQHRSTVRRYGVVLALIGALAVPVNSADVFLYIGFGRIMVVHHANPYEHSYREFSDEYSNYAWYAGSMPYGPVFLPFAAVAGLVSEWNVLGAVFVLKAIWVALYALTLWLLTLAETGPRGIFLFACNPIIILELLSNAHIDAIVVACLAAAVYLSRRKRFLWAMIVGTLAALTKLPLAVILGPIIVLAARLKAWRAITVYAAAMTMLVFAALATQPVESLMSFVKPPGVISTSSVQVQALKMASTAGQEMFVQFLFALVYVAFYSWRLTRIRNYETFCRELAYVVLGLLVYSPQFQPWFVPWFVTVAAFSTAEGLVAIAAALSFSSLSVYGLRYASISHIPALRVLRIAVLYLIPCSAYIALTARVRRSVRRDARDTR
jgi:hypothetical protein